LENTVQGNNAAPLLVIATEILVLTVKRNANSLDLLFMNIQNQNVSWSKEKENQQEPRNVVSGKEDALETNAMTSTKFAKLLELSSTKNLANTRRKETSLTAVNSLIKLVKVLLVKENVTLSLPKKFQPNALGTNFPKDAREEVVVMFMKSAQKVLVQQRKDVISLEQSFAKNSKRLVSTRKFHQLVNNWNVVRK
jgi:hypothetical protein